MIGEDEETAPDLPDLEPPERFELIREDPAPDMPRLPYVNTY